MPRSASSTGAPAPGDQSEESAAHAREQRQAAEERELQPARAGRIGDEDDGDDDEREAEVARPQSLGKYPPSAAPSPATATRATRNGAAIRADRDKSAASVREV